MCHIICQSQKFPYIFFICLQSKIFIWNLRILKYDNIWTCDNSCIIEYDHYLIPFTIYRIHWWQKKTSSLKLQLKYDDGTIIVVYFDLSRKKKSLYDKRRWGVLFNLIDEVILMVSWPKEIWWGGYNLLNLTFLLLTSNWFVYFHRNEVFNLITQIIC